jgi:hypothetical protein
MRTLAILASLLLCSEAFAQTPAPNDHASANQQLFDRLARGKAVLDWMKQNPGFPLEWLPQSAVDDLMFYLDFQKAHGPKPIKA